MIRFAAAFAIALVASPAFAESVRLTAPYVIDGDTIADGATHYRISKLDAPESGDRAQCPAERALAALAAETARDLLSHAERVTARTHGLDKYRRTLADLDLDGKDFAQAMIAAGVARPYKGKRPWCTQ